jgi:hypothetical protein
MNDWSHLPPPRRKRRKQAVEVDGETATIVVERRNGDQYRALMDADVLPIMGQYTWWIDMGMGKRSPYAATTAVVAGRSVNLAMHRLILNPGSSLHVDHRDGDGLNNRRSNLRSATVTQNRANELVRRVGTASQYKGVKWRRQSNGWVAQCVVDGRMKYLGLYDREIDAALAYDDAVRSEYGDFAATNFTVSFADSFERQGRRQRPGVSHGVSGYVGGCRCDTCLEIGRAYHRERYHARQARRAAS